MLYEPRQSTLSNVSTLLVILGALVDPLPTVGQQEGLDAFQQLDLASVGQRLLEQKEWCQNAESTEDLYGKVGCRTLDGIFLLGMGQHDAGLRAFQEALDSLESIDDLYGIAFFHLVTAESSRHTYRGVDAVASYEKAIDALEELRQTDKPVILKSISFFSRMMGLPDVSDQIPEMFLQVMKPFLISQLELVGRDALANLLMFQERYGEAEEQLEKARVLSANLSGVMDAQLIEKLGQLWERQGCFTKAREFYEEVIDLPANESRRDSLVKHLATMETGDEQCHPEMVSSGHATSREQATLAVGRLLREAGEQHLEGRFVESAALLSQAVDEAKKSGFRYLEAQTLAEAGFRALTMNRHEDAIRFLERRLILLPGLEGPTAKIGTLTLLAWMNSSLGFDERADQQFAEVEALGRRLNMSILVTAARCGLAYIKFHNGETEEAIRLMKDHLEEVEESGGFYREMNRMQLDVLLALMLMDLGEYCEAEMYLQSFLQNPFRKLFPTPHFEVLTHLSQAAIHWYWREADQALEHAEQGYELARRAGWRELVAASRGLKAAILYNEGKGQVEDSLRILREVVDSFDTMAGEIQITDLKSGLIHQQNYQIYDPLIDILMERSASREAFEVAEKARARSFLRLIADRRLSRRRPAAEKIAEAERLHRRIRVLEALGTDAELQRDLGATSEEKIRDDLHKTRIEYSDLLLEITPLDSEHVEMINADIISFERLQREVLNENTSLVSYFVTPKKTHIWVINHDGLHVASVEVGRAKLTEEIQKLREALPFATDSRVGENPSETTLDVEGEEDLTRGAVPLPGGEENGRLAVLYEHLIAPIEAHLNNHRLLIVPHGPLHYLPFAALWDGEEHYLVETHELIYAPSASVLPHLVQRSRSNGKHALVLGDPDTEGRLPRLYFARSEAERVADLLGGQALIGEDATEARVWQEASGARWIHLAAHGIYAKRPLHSRLELAQGRQRDGHLEVHEILEDLDLRGVELVTLSACETALGERSNGDEIVGLERAFLYAGASAVVSSLWSIDDQASGELMVAFYDELKSGRPVAEALRSAQLQLLGDEKWRAPYYWAAFRLTGSLRTDPVLP